MMEVSRWRHTVPYSSSTYYILGQREAVVIDPGIMTVSESIRFADAFSRFEKVHILHTHMHYDHIASTEDVRRRLESRGVEVIVYHHREGADALRKGDTRLTVAEMFGVYDLHATEVDVEVYDGFKLVVEKTVITVVHTPGHTIDSVVYVADFITHAIAFTGDTVFCGGVPGRTDLPTGSTEMLIASLKKLRDTVLAEYVCPGHGLCCNESLKMVAQKALEMLM